MLSCLVLTSSLDPRVVNDMVSYIFNFFSLKITFV